MIGGDGDGDSRNKSDSPTTNKEEEARGEVQRTEVDGPRQTNGVESVETLAVVESYSSVLVEGSASPNLNPQFVVKDGVAELEVPVELLENTEPLWKSCVVGYFMNDAQHIDSVFNNFLLRNPRDYKISTHSISTLASFFPLIRSLLRLCHGDEEGQCSATTIVRAGEIRRWKAEEEGVAYVLHACAKLNSEGQKCDEGTEAAVLAFPDDPTRQDYATFGDFVTSETDEVINAQTQRIQTQEEVECHWNMETLDIVQEEGITSAYEQHSGKFQPKPRRLLDPVIEEEVAGSHYSVDDATGANQFECMLNECTNAAFYGEYQEEEEDNIPQESAPDVLEQEHRVVSPSNNDTVMGQGETQSNEAETRTDKKGEKKRGRKKKATTNEEEEEEANKSPEKKFKHSSGRQKNRSLEKELLETPDGDIKRLPMRDMIRLVRYRESLEKKEAKRAPVVPPTQESNTNASFLDNHYYSQGFDAEEGVFGMEEDENYVQVQPDSPVNYHTNMKKTPRTRWSKQDTQLFYKGIQAFGIDLPMVHLLFPEGITLQQIRLKYKLEDRKNPWKINDAISTRRKDLTSYHTVIKKLEQKAAAAKEGEEAETTTDVPENEEETDERAGDGVAGVNESDGGDQFDENEGDDDVDDFFINSYKSEM
ncbi:Homeodomain-like superfamily protein [Raphanus sativus]|nr:Homeodomain-like superfamily protein [Raphanus sativus]